MDRNRRIPRIMHQIYLNGEMPKHLKRNVEIHKACNPHWEHRLYDEEAAKGMIVEHYGEEMLSRYQRISDQYPAARADLLRHLIIYAYGGVYFDIKSCFDRPLDEIIRVNDSYLLAQWQNGPCEQNEGWGVHHDLVHIPGGEYISYFIIAESGHPFSKAVIDKIVRNIKHPVAACRQRTRQVLGPLHAEMPVDDRPHEYVGKALACRGQMQCRRQALVGQLARRYRFGPHWQGAFDE